MNCFLNTKLNIKFTKLPFFKEIQVLNCMKIQKNVMYISSLFLTYHELYKKARGLPWKDEKISHYGIKMQKKEQIASKINTILCCKKLVDNVPYFIICNDMK